MTNPEAQLDSADDDNSAAAPDAGSPAADPYRRHRRWQFAVGGLLAVVAIVPILIEQATKVPHYLEAALIALGPTLRSIIAIWRACLSSG